MKRGVMIKNLLMGKICYKCRDSLCKENKGFFLKKIFLFDLYIFKEFINYI